MNPLPSDRWARFLQRPAVSLHPALLHGAAAGRRILITGAGGSVGSALTRALLPGPHASLTLLDHSEGALYELHSEFGVQPRVELLLGDAGDPALLRALFRDLSTAPDLVLHTAAYKHVPLLESQPFAAVRNNVLATAALLHACPSAQFVLLSTDKAADPLSVMGATKRAAELLALSAGATVVRLVNVLGSHGSVVPRFQQQIAAGSPLTVTSPTATRYWMTEDEAVETILASICIRRSGIFAPLVNQPRPVLELARFLAAEASQPNLPITFTGLRPGDKASETLLGEGERWRELQSSSNLRQIHTPHPAPPELAARLRELEAALQAANHEALLTALRELCRPYTTLGRS